MRICCCVWLLALLAARGAEEEAEKRQIVDLVSIEPGQFLMGSDSGNADEKPLHKAMIEERLWIGKHEITQEEYSKVMGSNPSRFKGSRLPVETVSWEEAVEFCRKLTDLDRKEGRLREGHEYRLPTEAEWEYCCRAGTATDYYFGDDVVGIGEYEWTRDNSGDKTHDAGLKKPNKWGLYDMAGNVREWCLDWYGDYPSLAVTDPTGPKTGDKRVYRGGDWFYAAKEGSNRSAHRFAHLPSYANYHVGFRIVLAPGTELLQKRRMERLERLREQVRELVKQLGDVDFRRRREAEEKLRTMGQVVHEALREYVNHEDPEVRAAVRAILKDAAATLDSTDSLAE